MNKPPRHGKPWTQSENEYLRLNYPTRPTDEVAQELGRTVFSVYKQAEYLGVKVAFYHPDQYTSDDLDLLREIYALTPHNEIVQLLGRTEGSIKKMASHLGLRKLFRYCKSNVNPLAFQTLTPETAYVLGYIVADGNIGDGDNVHLGVGGVDYAIMCKIRDVLKSDHPFQKKTLEGRRPFYYLRIYNSQLVNDLNERWGVTPRKSFTVTLPPVPDDLFFDFLRGYFDGDGYAHYDDRPPKFNMLTIQFTSVSKQLLDDISAKLSALLGVHQLPWKHRQRNSYSLSYRTREVAPIFEAMYRSANDLFLEYKRLPYERYLEHQRYHKHPTHWTPEELEYLRQTYQSLDVNSIAQHLQRSPGAVRDKLGRLKLMLRLVRR